MTSTEKVLAGSALALIAAVSIGVMEKGQSAESVKLEAAAIVRAKEHMQKAQALAPKKEPNGKLECACSSGRDCEQFKPAIPESKRLAGWFPAAMGNTIPAKRWRGPGCVPKECAARGEEVWPLECPGG